MLQIVKIILPVILLVAFGWLLARRKIFNAEVGNGLNQFVFYAAIPALIFYAVYKTDIHQLLDWSFILTYFIIFMVMFWMVFIIYRLVLKKSQGISAIAAMATAFTNVGLIGLPILLLFVGKQAIIPVAIVIIVAMLIYIPMLTLLLETSINNNKDKKVVFLRMLKHTLLHPFVLATLLGVIVSASQLKVPVYIAQFVNYLQAATIPCALIIIGIELNQLQLGNLKEVLILSLVTLIVKPLLTFWIITLFHLDPFFGFALIVTNIVPTGKNVYIIAKRYNTFEKEASGIISVTTLLSAITIPIFLLMAQHFYPTILASTHSVSGF